MRVYPSVDYLETEICFLCEVDLKGTIYRFSNYPIDLAESAGGTVFYGGRLEDPSFAQELINVGQVKLSTNSISLALVFPFNVAQRQINGIGIDNAKLSLFYVTVKGGEPQQLYNDKVPFFQGVIREPVYGHPDRDEGYVEFSVENEIYINDTSLLRAINGDLVSFDNFPFATGQFQGAGEILNIETEYIGSGVRFSLGKIVPAIIGQPGLSTLINGGSLEYAGSPAYLIGIYFDPQVPAKYFLLLAGHYCKASSVTIQDNDGNIVASKLVFNTTAASGQMYAYTFFDQTELSYPINNDERKYEYYVRWVNGGGAISPYTGQELSRGGDLIVWALSALDVDYDREAFESVRPILNQYIFAGYINDPGIKVYEYLQKYIIPFLPVALVAGAKGIYPVIDHRNTDLFMSPRLTITADELFERVSAVQPRETEIVNDVVVKYASGFESSISFTVGFGVSASQKIGGSEYKGSIYIRAKRQEGTETPYEVISPYCIISQQRYGLQSQTIELDYVHDRETAIKIGLDLIRRKSLPEKVVRYQAPFAMGYLMIGDIIALTDTEIGLSESTVQIVGKEYSGASWFYDVMFQENPIDNERLAT